MKYVALAVVLVSWVVWEYQQLKVRKHKALVDRIVGMSPPAKPEEAALAPFGGAGR